jgi:hypothetical protein
MSGPETYQKQWDVFLSYASEDTNSIARPIAEGLRHHGLRVWFDQFELHVGDSLTKAINNGLANSLYGVVILSPAFFGKKWTQNELAALVALEEPDRRRIFPVWHQLGVAEITEAMPILADVVAVQSSMGIPGVVRELLRAIRVPFVGEGVAGFWAGRTGRLRLFQGQGECRGDYDWNGHDWAGHIHGSLEVVPDPDSRPSLVLKFSWCWDLSPERGNGFFHVLARPDDYERPKLNVYLRAPVYGHPADPSDANLLSGAWAFDHENLDLSQKLRELRLSRPHPWRFERTVSLE